MSKHTRDKENKNKKSHIFLDELDVGVEGLIIVMIYRKWDVSAVTSRHLSTDFVVSDEKVR